MNGTLAGKRENQNGSLRSEERFIRAITRSSAATVLDISSFVDSQGDLGEPARVILCTAVGLAQLGIAPSRDNVVDQLRRSELLDRRIACWLASAMGQDTPADSVHCYAQMVVAQSLRRRVRNWSNELLAMVESGTETELAVTTEVFATAISEVFERLRFLRQGTDG